MRPLTHSCFLLLLGRLSLLGLLTCFSSLWSPLFPPYDPALISLSRQGASSDVGSLPPYDLVLWTDSSVPFSFGKSGSSMFAKCSLCGTEATLSFSAGSVCSSFSAEACAILQGFRWSRQHQEVCHFSFSIRLSFCPHHPALSSIFPFISNSVADLAGTVFFLLLFYQATMGPRTLVSPGERRG